MNIPLHDIASQLDGELRFDQSILLQYATDASVYRELPTAVAWPKNKADIRKLIAFAQKYGLSLIPRAAGTSLAGQVVGAGIVVDISKHWGRIIDIDPKEHHCTVEPGVIPDELNMALKPYGLFFGPETSTANRCMIAGMVGNNSCGLHSLVYGSTRDHLLAVWMILDDGNEYRFGEIDREEFDRKCKQNDKEGELYRFFNDLLSNADNCTEIINQSPHPDIRRRNTGYALDSLVTESFFGGNTNSFNLAKLIAGSEGTLGIITRIQLNLVPLPPKERAIVAVHLHRREEAFRANLIALKHHPTAVELMDSIILQCTKGNTEQQRNRFFVKDDPGAILIVEFAADTVNEIDAAAEGMQKEMQANGFGYHFPIIRGAETAKVWALRKAGLGVLSNVDGDAKPVSLVEDTAVAVADLPEYMDEFAAIMQKHKLDCVYHAHIGTGELHLRPVLNLKDPNDVELFRTVALEVAMLVKKYRGSLSGEHGDGRLRGEFIPIMAGDKVYSMMREVKHTFDPRNLFNPGKIIDTPPMNSALRYTPGKKTRTIPTLFNFDKVGGIIRATEKCNGSGDCRKTHLSGGTLCPSYMVTRNEANTTRARANLLREFLTNTTRKNPFDHRELYDILDLCLSCKGCKSECPSSVDMAKLKAEFLQHWYDEHGIPVRSRLIAYITHIYRLGSIFPGITNFFLTNPFVSRLMMRILGFEPKRKFPKLSKVPLTRWYRKREKPKGNSNGRVYLLPDEFTNYNDAHIGIKAVKLLESLGYEVLFPRILESGRTYISKGLIRTAQRIANRNIETLAPLIDGDTPLIGIEPSAILSFRDEYPDLASNANNEAASKLAQNSLLFEEFFVREVKRGRIKPEQFTDSSLQIKLHGHCQQKAVASTKPTKQMLSFPVSYSVTEIPSGCCGMAGAFGYEKEHYELSMKVGELVLFPSVRETPDDVVIAAPGTSCRHQIADGTGRTALHPIEIMWDALIK